MEQHGDIPTLERRHRCRGGQHAHNGTGIVGAAIGMAAEGRQPVLPTTYIRPLRTRRPSFAIERATLAVTSAAWLSECRVVVWDMACYTYRILQTFSTLKPNMKVLASIFSFSGIFYVPDR